MTNALRYALGFVFSVIAAYAGMQHILLVKTENNLAKAQAVITEYEVQMTELSIAAKKANDEANVAWGLANKAMAAASEKQQEIMKQNVSHDCEKAMKWGLEQARGL